MPSRLFRRLLLSILALAACVAVRGQLYPDTIQWMQSVKQDGQDAVVTFTGRILKGWHTYSLKDPDNPTSIEFETLEGATLNGEPEEMLSDEIFVIRQAFKLDGPAKISGTISWRSCLGNDCRSPEDYDFDLTIDAPETVSSSAPAISQAGGESKSKIPGSIWALILEAILWGFAMLLTPCVFPMVPMTISFFLKGSKNKAQGKFKAAMYGLFIVLLYTVPISLIILITYLVGGQSVTADIFNWLSTHWLPNLLFFVIFMLFAASFFGAFEIQLPSSLVNKSDKNSDRGGLAGVFFMALTLVLVSFSCTGPIVGTVLIKSTQGEFWTPMVTMLAFSIAFALPFTLLALFPSLLENLPKSGGWLNSVKVTLGFIELALGLKFLSTADQTYHWGILDREVYLALWIVIFTLLGFYLLGKLRFKYDSELKHISLGRLVLAIIDFAFVVYLIPGMWGAPLKGISGYLPPMETQDFVIGKYNPETAFPQSSTTHEGATLDLAQGLKGYATLEEGLAAAKAAGKPVFVDITGYGCVNCREMEARVWSDPQVLSILNDDYIIVALHTDDKTKLPENEWLTTENGKVLKDRGRVNSYIVRERFGVNAQPNYALLSSDGQLLAPVRGYDLSIPGFLDFLKQGLD